MRSAFLFLLAISQLSAGVDLRIAGSDLLGAELSRTLCDWGARQGVAVALAFDGSRPGLEQWEQHRAELVLTLTPSEEALAVAGGVSLVLGYYALVVVAPKDSSMEIISLPEIRDVIAESGKGRPRLRMDLGEDLRWAAAQPPEATLPAVGAMMLEGLRQPLGSSPELVPAHNHRGPESDRASARPQSALEIVLAGSKLAAERKIVAVAMADGEPAFTPTPDNIHAGDYPLRLPFRAVFRRESARELRPILRFLLGDELAAVFSRAGMVPLAPPARHHQRLAVESL